MRAAFMIVPVLIVVAVCVLTAGAAEQAGAVRLTPSEIERMATDGAGAGTSGVAGIRTTTLTGDPTKSGPYTIALSVPAHTRIQSHTHRDARSAVVVSGAWYFGYGEVASDSLVKELKPGSFYTEPASSPHFALTREQPALVYITGIGPTDTRYQHEESKR
jgi:quercetin dioxygenase-like cupin family protein